MESKKVSSGNAVAHAASKRKSARINLSGEIVTCVREALQVFRSYQNRDAVRIG